MVYGLIIGNELFHLKKLTNEKRYNEIYQSIAVNDPSIDVTKRYPENLWTRVGKKAAQSLGINEEEFFEGVGISFVKFVESYKFDQLTSLIGREYREFVMNLDNVHHYLGEMFTHMKAPSFFVESESPTGMCLVYRSKRRGYTHYTVGQMKEISKVFFNKVITMKPVKQEIQFDTVYVKYKLEFDNTAFIKHQEAMQKRVESSLAFKAFALFEVFPFSVLFNDQLNINVVGNALRRIIPDCVGQPLIQFFKLERPLVEVKWEVLLTKTNNVFVFQLLANVKKTGRLKKYKLQSVPEPVATKATGDHDELDNSLDDEYKLQIKGQLIFIEEWRKILFLGCPIIPNLKRMIENGLFISDMSTHDLSRDIMMAFIQKQFEKKMTDNLAIKTAEKLEEIEGKFKNLHEENELRRVVWIPKLVRELVDEAPVHIHKDASLLWAQIFEFDNICKATYLAPKKFIELLDNALSAFDHLSKKNSVTRVETVDGYLAAGGLTEGDEDSAERVATLALDLRDAAEESLRDPSTKRRVMIKFQIGLFNGPVVSAIIGNTIPKFVLLGNSIPAVEKYSSLCPPGRILMCGSFKKKLTATCRYSNAPSFVNEELDKPAFILDSKQDHIKVPVAPVLRAYAKFKHAKIQHALEAKTLEDPFNDDDIMDLMAKNGAMCNSTTVCNIL